jgi:hypothetical protein
VEEPSTASIADIGNSLSVSRGGNAFHTAKQRHQTDIPSEFRIYSRGRAYRVMVGVQLPRGGRFAREAVIEPDRTAPLGFRVREWTVPAAAIADVSELSAGTVQCVHALA